MILGDKPLISEVVLSHLSWIMLLRSALRAIVDGWQSAHTGIPVVLEERAMLMIARIFTSLQTLSSTVFLFFIF
jgi:hypothetical protein